MRNYALEGTIRNLGRHIDTAKETAMKTIYYGFIPVVILLGLNSARNAAGQMA